MEDEYVDAHDAPPHQQQQQTPNLKIPLFWASNPEAWFGMVEGQFILRNITQDNLRFYYVLGALPESAVRGMGDQLSKGVTSSIRARVFQFFLTSLPHLLPARNSPVLMAS